MLSRADKEKIWYLHSVEKMNNTQISEQLGVARGTVIKVLKHKLPENEQLLNEVKEIQEEKNKELLELIKNDKRVPNILNKIIKYVDKEETIAAQVKTPQGLKSLMTVYGILADKHMNAKKLDHDERRIKAQEKMVILKEKELEMRTMNPQAFQDVVIIDDAEEAYKYNTEINQPTNGSTS